MNTEPWVTPSGWRLISQVPREVRKQHSCTLPVLTEPWNNANHNGPLVSPKWAKASLYSGYDSTSLWLFLFLSLLLFLLSGSLYCCLCCYSLFSMSRLMGRAEAHPEGISPKIRNLIESKMKPFYWAQEPWTTWQCWPILCPTFARAKSLIQAGRKVRRKGLRLLSPKTAAG